MKEAKILFDPVEHKYTDTDGNAYTSVTTYIDKFKVPFDKEYWAAYRAVDRSYGKYGIRPDTINRRIWVKQSAHSTGQWYSIAHINAGLLPLAKVPSNVLHDWKVNAEEACKRGNNEHDYLEDCVNDFFSWKVNHDGKSVRALEAFAYSINDMQTLENSRLKSSHPTVYELLAGLIESGYTLYAEKRIYSYEHLISGMIDILAVNSDGEFWIVDWKTNKDPLQFESGYFKKAWNANRTEKVKTTEWVSKDERLKSPLEDLQVCKGSLYTLQLSLYARLCELWGLKCKGLMLCHLRIEVDKDKELIRHEPIFYDINYIPHHVDRILKLREQPKHKKKQFSRKPSKY